LFDLNSLSSTDLDMRLSAARVTVGSTRLGRTAFGAQSARRRAGAERRRGADYGGIAKGSFGSRGPTRSPTSRHSSRSPTSNCNPAASELFGVTKLSGRGNLNVSLMASGSSPFGLAQSLDGTASLIGHDGAIGGFNVEQLLKRPGAPAAVRRRQPSQRLDALRQSDHRGEIQRGYRHRRGYPGRGTGGAHHLERHRLGCRRANTTSRAPRA